MIGVAIVLALLSLGALAWIAAPLLRGETAAAGRRSAGLDRARELQSRHQQLLASLRDLEDDRATEKIDRADYEEMRARLSAEAIDLMRELDALREEREAAADAASKGAIPLHYPGAGRPGPRT